MADRDWSKELEKIDKHIASLPADAPAAAPAPAPKAARGGSSAVAPSAAGLASPKGQPQTTSFGVYARLGLAVLLGVAMVLWPYEARCGAGLAAYLAAVAVVVAGGAWASVWTWRHRAARAHTLSLLIVLWGLVLGSLEVLPRVGYAKPTLRHPAAWSCP